MVAPNPPLPFDTAFAPEAGQAVEVVPGIVRVTAPNAGPYTFRGTNTFLIGEGPLFVLDPGPDDPGHLEALQRAIGGRGVAAIVITHTHRDHTGLVPRLQAATGAPLWFGGRHRSSRPPRFLEPDPVSANSDWQLVPDRVLADGDHIAAGGTELEVIATPGHCANHLAFGVTGTPWLFTGDHIMGWSTTVITPPDGDMTDYLESLDRIRARGFATLWPTHGPPVRDVDTFIAAYIQHRQERVDQILGALKAGPARIADLVPTLYADVDPRLHPAAARSMLAAMIHLARKGELETDGTPGAESTYRLA